MKQLNLSKLLLMAVLAFLTSLAGVWAFLHFSTQGPKLGGDFELQKGSDPWVFSKNARPLNLLYFGYVKCPDVCPLTLSFVAQAFKKLSPQERQELQFIFLSVDHEHETPADVALFARQFNPDFVGLSGTAEQIQTTLNLFGASFILEKDPKSYLGYSIVHTDTLFFLDHRGKVVNALSNPRSSEEIIDKIKGEL